MPADHVESEPSPRSSASGPAGSGGRAAQTITHPSDPAGRSPGSAPGAVAGPAPDVFAGYEVDREIHRGGQGVVYHARQKTTGREVAIKVMHQGPFAGGSDLARFELEVRILGQLKHPSIVAIHDSGVAGGSFFYVMDYIDGRRLDEHVESRKASIRESLALFVKICDAVNAAHLRGVIHRDLKPGNILVDAAGNPHILDFGLAKIAADSTTVGEGVRRAMTITGQFVGSLPWASPEQAEGRPDKIDVRTDVYSLGVILYQMLTGVFPYDTSGSLHHALDHILRSEPKPPSALREQVDDEVETIVMKCLHKERERRYQTAGELSQDVQRYLAGEPIEAKRDSGWYVLRKTLRRYRGLVALAGLFLLSGFGFGAFMAYQYSRAQMRLEKQQAEQALAARQDAERREQLASRRLYATRIALAEGKRVDNDVAGLRDLLDACPEALRGWEWTRLSWLADRSTATLRGHTHFVAAVAVSADGRRIVSAGHDNVVRVWETDDGRTFAERLSLEGHARPVLAVAIRPDGAQIASAGQDRIVRLWDAVTGAPVAELAGHRSHVGAVAFSPDGAQLASADLDGLIRTWTVASGAPAGLFRGHAGGVHALAFSPDGRELASAGDDRDVHLWNVATASPQGRLKGHNGAVRDLAFAADGKRLASGGDDGVLIVWDLGRAAPQHMLVGHVGPVRGVRFAPDGAQVLSAGDDTTLRVWDAATGEAALTLRGHTDDIEAVAVSADGARVVTASRDQTLKLWSISGGEELLMLRGHFMAVNAAAFSPDGARIASAGRDLTVKLWDAATGEEQRTIAAHDWSVRAVAFSADGQRVVSGSEDGALKIFDAESGEELRSLRGHGKQVHAIAVHSATRQIISGGADGVVRVWDFDSGREVAALTGHDGPVLTVAISPDGRVIASGGGDRDVRLWEAGGGETLRVLQGHEGAVNALAFLGRGEMLVSASDDNTLKVWQTATGADQLTLRGHSDAVRAVACSPDGARIVSGGEDRTIKLWDPVGGEEVISLRGHQATVTALAFAPRNGRIVSCAEDGQLRLWDNAEAPEDTRARRAAVATARRRVDALFSELTFSADVVARLASEPLLADEQRAIAVSIATARGDNPLQLNSAAWTIAQDPERRPEEYAKALRMAELACKLARNVGAYLNTLGVAQYRAGQFETALQTLEASRANNGDHPADVTFIALAQHRLGRSADARRSLELLKSLMRDPAYARDDLWLDFLREAERAIDPAAADNN